MSESDYQSNAVSVAASPFPVAFIANLATQGNPDAWLPADRRMCRRETVATDATDA
jgi:hypothetical protein